MTNQKDKNPRDMNKKRKNEDTNNGGRANQIPRRTTSSPSPAPQLEEERNGMLELSLGSSNSREFLSLSLLPPEFSHPLPPPPPPVARATRQRRNNNLLPRDGKSETIPPPFEWATDRRATVHTLEHLISNEIRKIKGEVQCKRCESRYEMEFDLLEKFAEVAKFICENKHELHERAPDFWKSPTLPTCRNCEQENSAKPVIPPSKKAINWLFLLLGQMLGCCTLDQLRYFCKHTNNHRTGAKDRVLYLAYLSLCKQLDPDGPFDR